MVYRFRQVVDGWCGLSRLHTESVVYQLYTVYPGYGWWVWFTCVYGLWVWFRHVIQWVWFKTFVVVVVVVNLVGVEYTWTMDSGCGLYPDYMSVDTGGGHGLYLDYWWWAWFRPVWTAAVIGLFTLQE